MLERVQNCMCDRSRDHHAERSLGCAELAALAVVRKSAGARPPRLLSYVADLAGKYSRSMHMLLHGRMKAFSKDIHQRRAPIIRVDDEAPRRTGHFVQYGAPVSCCSKSGMRYIPTFIRTRHGVGAERRGGGGDGAEGSERRVHGGGRRATPPQTTATSCVALV
eukprot:72082-Pleurochrysis_carterae.AAC.7